MKTLQLTGTDSRLLSRNATELDQGEERRIGDLKCSGFRAIISWQILIFAQSRKSSSSFLQPVEIDFEAAVHP